MTTTNRLLLATATVLLYSFVLFAASQAGTHLELVLGGSSPSSRSTVYANVRPSYQQSVTCDSILAAMGDADADGD